MKSILNALQDGRLIELPDNDKTTALEYLAAIIEGIPDIQAPEAGIAVQVLDREQHSNTGIGKGWACPHARFAGDGEVVCALGWSPDGIDYGAPDGKLVHFLVMYYIPENQKNAYLKEISSLAKAISTMPDLQSLESLDDLSDARHRLLDAIGLALESTAPEARARMIRLEARQAQADQTDIHIVPSNLVGSIIPLRIVCHGRGPFFILAQNESLVSTLEALPDIPDKLSRDGVFQFSNMQLALLSSTTFQPDRSVLECICYTTENGSPA